MLNLQCRSGAWACASMYAQACSTEHSYSTAHQAFAIHVIKHASAFTMQSGMAKGRGGWVCLGISLCSTKPLPTVPVLLGGHAADGLDLLKCVQHTVLQQHPHAEGRVACARLAQRDICFNELEDLVPVRICICESMQCVLGIIWARPKLKEGTRQCQKLLIKCHPALLALYLNTKL